MTTYRALTGINFAVDSTTHKEFLAAATLSRADAETIRAKADADGRTKRVEAGYEGPLPKWVVDALLPQGLLEIVTDAPTK